MIWCQKQLEQNLRRLGALILTVAGLAVGGCSSSGVYRELDGWLVCENARPQYHAYYDVFYVAPEAYSGRGDYPYAAHDQALEETTRMFGKHVRIFAPIYHDRRDVEKAFWHYIDTYHGNGLPWPMNDDTRPFVFVGEGQGAAYLADFARRKESKLRKLGFVGAWCSPETTNGFVTAEMVSDVNQSVKRVRYLKAWDRDEND